MTLPALSFMGVRFSAMDHILVVNHGLLVINEISLNIIPVTFH
ncbi:protein of unknown function [Vibrio tapetis subsp. tapetis]|uniref:Uncharacterized protein n=1 Tax=Vibrio tapetis subsp. tapetis TaxID=1671868 RepID=A0A2N8ZMK0_9VIBR|nr:protein of unknown function [Vibrio tapetis subsp. tapetis]